MYCPNRKKERRTHHSQERIHEMRKPLTNESGMSLLEVMVVLVIISMMLGTVGVVVQRQLKKARLRNASNVIHNVHSAVELYMMENNGDCPESLSALHADGTLSKEAKDPWGKELQFACPGEENSEGFDLLSSGPDKKFGTEDDIADQTD